MIFAITLATVTTRQPYISTESAASARTDTHAFDGLCFALSTGVASKDPVLKINVANSTSKVIQLRLSNVPGLDVSLDVRNASGISVSPTSAYRGPTSYEIRDRPIDPGASLEYDAPLSDWGYHLAPGTYHVTAFVHSFATKTSLRSHTLTIVVGR